MADNTENVRVEIYDRVYDLRTSADENYTRRLAKSVDAAMRHIAENTHTYDSLRLAVLAALHFADECQQLRDRYEKLSGMVSKKSLQFGAVLDRAVRQTD